MLQDRVGQLNPLAIQVRESGSSNRQVEVEVYSLDAPPSGDLRLFVAVVEKEIQYNAPNGETLHHDVFRDMLTNKDGDSFSPAAAGGSVTASFNFTVANDWNVNQAYVLAFVQDYATKEVFNSGTRFDPVINSTSEELAGTMRLYPNPVQKDQEVILEFASEKASTATFSLLSLTGQALRSQRSNITIGANRMSMSTAGLPKGLYMVRIDANGGANYRKLVVQ